MKSAFKRKSGFAAKRIVALLLCFGLVFGGLIGPMQSVWAYEYGPPSVVLETEEESADDYEPDEDGYQPSVEEYDPDEEVEVFNVFAAPFSGLVAPWTPGAGFQLRNHYPLDGEGLSISPRYTEIDIVGGRHATAMGWGGLDWIDCPEFGRYVISIDPSTGAPLAVNAVNFGTPEMSALAVSFWARAYDVGVGIQSLMAFETASSANLGLFSLGFYSGNLGLGNGVVPFGPADPNFFNGEWRHFALIFEDHTTNGITATLLVDGVQFGTPIHGTHVLFDWWHYWDYRTVEMRLPTLDIFNMGGTTVNQLFHGRMADVRVHVLPPAGGATPNLIHHWLLDGDGTDEIGYDIGFRHAAITAATFTHDADWNREVLNLDTPGGGPSSRQSPFHVIGLDDHNLDEVTVAFWLRPGSLNPPSQGLTNIAVLENPTAANSGLFYLSNFHVRDHDIGLGSSDTRMGVFNWNTNAGRWMHIALTFRDDVATMYLNGAFFAYIEDEVTIDNWWGSPNPATVPVRVPNLDVLGIGGTNTAQVVIGRVADVRLYGSSLTATQVNAIFMEAPVAVRGIQGDMLHRWLMDGSGANTGTSGRAGSAMVPYATFVYDIAWGDYVLNIDPTGIAYGGHYTQPFEAPGPSETFTDVSFTMWVRETVNPRPNFHFLLNGDDFAIGRTNDTRLFAHHPSFAGSPHEIDAWNNVASAVNAFPLGMQSSWQHIAYVIGDGYVRYFVNGVQYGQTPFTDDFTVSTYRIGGNVWQAQIFPGRIADFRVYDRVLTAQEVFNIFDAVTLNEEPSEFALTAITTRYNSNLFYQGAAESLILTASGLNALEGDDATLRWQITNWLGAVAHSGTHTFLGSGADTQEFTIAVDTSSLGWFNLEATLEDALGDELALLPTQGTLSLNSLPFGVVPDPAGRRLNARHAPDGSVIPGPNGEGIDEFISFGIWNAHPGTMPDGVTMSEMLGATMSTTSMLSWWHFVYPALAHPGNTYPTPGFPLLPPGERVTNVDLLAQEALPGAFRGGLLRGHMYPLLEMTPYFPPEFRVFPGLGAYGGQLNTHGEEQLYLYMRGIAQIHIAQAPHRPRHYFMPLWEPNYQWGAWFPGGDEGIRSIVRAHEIAYLAIHTAYAEHAIATGDDSWRHKAVVLGPNSSSFYPSWHQELFDEGLANFIDGLTIHAYHASPNDQSFLNSTRQVMDSALEAWERRVEAEQNGQCNGQGFPTFHDQFFFFQTEGGMFRDPNLTEHQGIEQQMQLLTRQMLIMIGEGFDHYQMFIFFDGGDPITRYMGLFYSLDDGPHRVAPKPVITAFAAATYLLTGYDAGGPLALGGSNLGYVFKDSITDSVKLALWNFSATPTTVSVNVGHDSVTVYDIMGNPQTVASPGGVLTITLDRNVQYVSGVNPVLFREEGTLVVTDTEHFIGDAFTVDVEFYNESSIAINNATVTLMFGVGSGIPNAVLSGQNFAPGMNRLTINAGNIPFTTAPDDFPINASITSASGEMIAIATGLLRVRPKIEIVLVQNFYDFAAGSGAMAVLLDNVSDEDKNVTFAVREGAFIHFTMGPFTMRANEERSILVPLEHVDLLTGANLIIEVTYVDAQNVTVTRPHEAIFTMMNYQRAPLPMSQISDIDVWRERVIPIWRGAEHQYQMGSVDFVTGLTDDNISGFLYFGWDAGGVWFGADITDDVHLNQAAENVGIWAGDAIQMAFNVNHLADLAGSEWTTGEIVTEIGFALTGDLPGTQRFHRWLTAPGATGPMGDYFIARDDADNRTVYMAFIPWAFLGMPTELAVAGYQIGISVSINDRDVPGAGWANQTAITLFGGIISSKDFNLFGPMTLVSDVEFILAPRLRAEAGDREVALYWSEAIPGADGYRIYVNGQLVETVAGNVTSFVVTGLISGATYTFEVVAISDRLNDGASNVVTVTLEDTGTPTPSPSPTPTPTPSPTTPTPPGAPSAPARTPAPTPPPSVEPIVVVEIVVPEDELLQAVEDGEAIVIDEDGVNLTIPPAILDELISTQGEDDELGDLDVSIIVWPPEKQPDLDNVIVFVEWSVTLGDEAVTGTETNAYFTLNFDLNDFDVLPEDFNPYFIVAILEDGTLLGGIFDPETGLFTLETQIVSDFVIAYITNLSRLRLRISSFDIVELTTDTVVVEMDVYPVIVDNRTLVPLRFVANAMGAEADWVESTRTVILTLGEQTLSFVIGELAVGMDVPAQIMNNRTMVPLRFVSEFFGAVVNWCAQTRTIEIIRKL